VTQIVNLAAPGQASTSTSARGARRRGLSRDGYLALHRGVARREVYDPA